MTRRSKPRNPRPSKVPLVVPLSTIEPVELTWLWESWVPSGGLTMLDGLPGQGKSAIMVDLCARVTRGLPMPDGTDGIGPAPIVYFNYEDASNGTMHRRFMAAGADLDLVHVHDVSDDGVDQVLELGPKSPIEEIIVGTKARLVVIDTIEHAAPGVNLDKGQAARSVLGPLNRLGQRTNAAIILIRHFNKNSAELNPTLRGGGSIGIIGVARAGIMLAHDPDNPNDENARILARYKCNDAPPVASQRFALAGDLGQPGALRIEWRGASPHQAKDLLGQNDDEPRGPRDEAKAFLLERLADGAVASREVTSEARSDGISPRTLERARTDLGVQHKREGGRTMLYLLDTAQPTGPGEES